MLTVRIVHCEFQGYCQKEASFGESTRYGYRVPGLIIFYFYFVSFYLLPYLSVRYHPALISCFALRGECGNV